MSRLVWEAQDYETGVDRGVFYPKDGPGEVWNGLISVQESPSELSSRTRYVDGRKVLNQKIEDSFAASVETFYYPDSFLMHPRMPFGMSWRVMTSKGYKIHLVYNALAHMNSRSYGQNKNTPFGFDISTRPVIIPRIKPTAHLIIDAEVAHASALEDFESVLYGNGSVESTMPTPEEVINIFEINALLRVINNGDGTFTITGPDEVVQMINGYTFEVAYPSAVYIDDKSYTISSF